jgi:acetolactate synthase-1/2/3 large subunit
MGAGAIPVDHPLSLLSVGLQSRDYVSCGFEAADLVIAVGYDFVEYHPQHWNPQRDKRIVHIDATTCEVDDSYSPKVEVVGDIRNSLEGIGALAQGRDGPHNYATALREAICEEIELYRDDRCFPIKPQRIISDIRSALGKEDILISDVGAHKIWIARMYPCYRPNTCLISNGLAAMGIALPGAIAAKIVHPERKVLAVSGDGGFMMNCQELETAVRLGTPFVNLVFNDEEYGLISWKQLNRFGRKTGVRFSNPDFLKLAESFGAIGYRVEGPDELPHILGEALRQNVPTVIDCPVDYSENVKLTEKLGRLVCPI